MMHVGQNNVNFTKYQISIWFNLEQNNNGTDALMIQINSNNQPQRLILGKY